MPLSRSRRDRDVMIAASPRTNGVGRHDDMKAPAGQVQRLSAGRSMSFHPDQNHLIAAIVGVRSDLRVNGKVLTESVRSAKRVFSNRSAAAG